MALTQQPFANAFAQPAQAPAAAPIAQPQTTGLKNAFNANLGDDQDLPWHSGPTFIGTFVRLSEPPPKPGQINTLPDHGIVFMNGTTRHRIASKGTRSEIEEMANSLGLVTESHKVALAESQDACTLARLHLRQLLVEHIGTQPVTITQVPNPRRQGTWKFAHAQLGAATPAQTAAAQTVQHDFSRFQ